MNNTVIKVLNKKHGRKVISFFKSKGVDVRNYQGNFNGEDYIYYGVINNCFDNYKLEDVRNLGATIITLPKDNPYPKVMMVSNYPINNTNVGKPRVVFMEKNGQYIAWANALTLKDTERVYNTFSWSYAKDIEKSIVELTIEDISKGKGIGIPPELIRIKK